MEPWGPVLLFKGAARKERRKKERVQRMVGDERATAKAKVSVGQRKW
jgi:hypothetical protein